MSYNVIDISKYNSISDYSKVSKNVDGVIVRAGYRAYKTGELKVDPLFQNHIEGCVKYNIPVGIYFFTTAINKVEGRAEADFAVNLIKKYKLSFPIFVDTEMSNNNKNGRSDSLTKPIRTEVVIGFCERIKELGYVPGIYASDSWFVSQLDYNKIQNYKLWVASYSRSPYRVPSYIAWQFSSKQSVPGISGNVDMSYWYEEIGNPKEETTIKKNPYLKPAVTVKKGMKGVSVRWVQWELVESGYNIAIDGDFGPKTLAAVKAFQKASKLVVDGIVGPKTIAALVAHPNKIMGFGSINQMPVTSAVYSASAKFEETDKVDFAVGAEFIVAGGKMYRTIFSLVPYTIVQGKCKVLSNISFNNRIKAVKVSTSDEKQIGWFKFKDIEDLFN